MNVKLLLSLLTLLTISTNSLAQSGAFGYKQTNEQQRNNKTTFNAPNQSIYIDAIRKNGWNIHSSNKHWVYFTATANEVVEAYKRGELPNYYIEYAPGDALNDSMRTNHHVNEVHAGLGLSRAYTGNDVIIGLVDTGIEINHPDFQHPDGTTRILRIWDQSTNTGGTLSPYGYGIVWTDEQINNGTCTHIDDSGHGSTVAGSAAGNGLATGYNKGVAPNADIIMIETNFNLPNWTLTVADACDYIFKVADTLGKRAVVNLSVGSYLGSHDGLDAAAVRIDQLLDEKSGRIVVGAAGNSGNWGTYHCHGDVTLDTTFVWLKNNLSSAFGPNKVFFDLYSDMTEATFNYSIKAINPNNGYETRASLIYRPVLGSLDTPIYDTLRNQNGDRIATVEIYTTQEGPNLNMQLYISKVDSTNYYYGFYTEGTGSYDFWSGTTMGYNEIVTAIPLPVVLPSIINYNLPDAKQTIVSSWNCSPKVVSVANVINRKTYIDNNGNLFNMGGTTQVGELSINSSKGPNRHNSIKPNVSASGDLAMSAAPIWYIQDPANYPKMDSGGWHMRNGGTSMASPVVAGVAALYLERCNKGSYAEFISLLETESMANAFTGTLPNNAYGYGLVNAFNIIERQEFTATVTGDSILCSGPNVLEVQTTEPTSSILWANGTTGQITNQYTEGDAYATVHNLYGCSVQTDTLEMVQISLETIQPIQVSSDYLTLTTTSSNGMYQWTKDGVDLPGETSNTLVLASIIDGMYDCYTFDIDTNCKVYAGGVGIYLGIESSVNNMEQPKLYPNPAKNNVTIESSTPILAVEIYDITGKELNITFSNNQFNSETLAKGSYFVSVITEKEKYVYQLIKE